MKSPTILVRPDTARPDHSGLIAKLRNDAIIYPRDELLQAKLAELVEQIWITEDPDLPASGGNRSEQDVLLVIGATGAGKTYSLNRAKKALKSQLCHPGERLEDRVISVKLPGAFSTLELARRILEKLGVRPNPEKLPNEDAMWAAVHGLLEARGIVILHLDEFQRFATVKTVSRAGKDEEAQRLAEKLNDLLTGHWPIALIISGIEKAKDFFNLEAMEQVGRRKHEVVFGEMTGAESRTLMTALNGYAKIAGITINLPSTYNLAGRLSHASFRTLGISLEMCQEAVVAAVRRQSLAVEAIDFGTMFASRFKSDGKTNVFVVNDWSKIPHKQLKHMLDDVAKVQAKRREMANAAR